jgi:ATP phosphoribosyltransferase regulatory subunit
MKPQIPERQLPYGVADVFFEQSAAKSQIEGVLEQTFDRWSYSEIIPPTIEYNEPLMAEASPQGREEIYRFFDRDGRMLALRANPTIPIARIASTKLHDRVLPLRCFGP